MYTPTQMAKMAWGKMRRVLIRHFDKAYMAQSLAKREGHCTRCGACCKLLYTCPFLVEDKAAGTSACSIHGTKPGNCIRFPIDARDLADRDHVMPDVKCGYSFPAEPSGVPLATAGKD